MGHEQPPTLVQADNSMAEGISNENLTQQCSCAMDLHLYWVNDRVKQGQFATYWAPGDLNLGDYFTKHHSPAHHRRMRPIYLHIPKEQASAAAMTMDYGTTLRGCVHPFPGTQRLEASQRGQLTLFKHQTDSLHKQSSQFKRQPDSHHKQPSRVSHSVQGGSSPMEKMLTKSLTHGTTQRLMSR